MLSDNFPTSPKLCTNCCSFLPESYPKFVQVIKPKNLHRSETFDQLLLEYWGLSGAQTCNSCRSRQELSNYYFVAQFGFDTAENGPFQVWWYQWKFFSPPKVSQLAWPLFAGRDNIPTANRQIAQCLKIIGSNRQTVFLLIKLDFSHRLEIIWFSSASSTRIENNLVQNIKTASFTMK